MEDINKLLIKIFNSDKAIVQERLLGGMMNETYIVSFNNKKYVLYIPQGNANEVVNRKEEKFILDISSSIGVSSNNVYFDVGTGIKCNEFIEGISLNKIDTFDYEKVAELLKAFHSSKTLSHYYYNPFNKLSAYKESVEQIHNLSEEFNTIYKTIFDKRSFLENHKIVLCHNDFQRSNIVKSQDKYYVIDFEFAANNDPIYDIAAFGNNSVKEGYALLNAYFASPTLEQKKTYYLWRMFISLQWHLVAILKDKNGEGKIHNFDFMQVANFFLDNALESYKEYKLLN